MILPFRQRREFEQLVHGYSADLFRFAYWLCRDRFVAEDLVQECFTRAWKYWDKLEDKSNPKPWLFTILRNENARLYERKQLNIVAESYEEFDIMDHHQPTELSDIQDLIKQLPASLSEPFLLQVLGGFSCAEIAEQMKTSEGAIMVRVSRARQKLRQQLNNINSTGAKAYVKHE